MNEITRRELTPSAYIRQLFAETQDGALAIHHYPFFDQPYALDYVVDWTAADVDAIVTRYESLTESLTRIAQQPVESEDADTRRQQLSPEDFGVWNTYLRPFPPFEVDDTVIGDLYTRMETDSLDDDEVELLERHHYWFTEHSRCRLPLVRYCPSGLINRARRYAQLVTLGAPDVVLAEEGRFLAEELVLYYHNVPQHKPNLQRFLTAQAKVLEQALTEIRNGKKRTHWMWFVFPQLRGLGNSTMSQTYGIADLTEATQYLSDLSLGHRLMAASALLLHLDTCDPVSVFGDVDAKKLHSCMTLFAYISPENSVFHRVLDRFFDGKTDPRTCEMLAVPNNQ